MDDAPGLEFGRAGAPTPHRILQIAFGFRGAKALLSAVEIGVFAALRDGPLELPALTRRLALHERGARDFFDALVALGLLERDQVGRYCNVADCALYLDPREPTCIGGMLEYMNARIYPCWDRLTQALRTGAPQSGPSVAGGYASFYQEEARFDTFMRGMSAGSLAPAQALADAFPWADYRTIVDIGTAQGCLLVEIAKKHPHLIGAGFDLPAVGPSFLHYVGLHGLAARLEFHAGDFLTDALPGADVFVMSRILHNWDLDVRKLLLRKAYAALAPNGSLVVVETLIDDTRRVRAHSLLASLNMLLQTDGGSEFTGAECTAWMEEAGFVAVTCRPLGPFFSAMIARK